MKQRTNTGKKSLFLTHAALIAALYVVLTLLSAQLGLASGNIQVRISEALMVLPFFTVAAIPGLTVGCFLANLLTGCALPDILFGPIATGIGAWGTYILRKKGKKLALIPPIFANAVIVPLILRYAYGIRPLWFCLLTVSAGEMISCGILGSFLMKVLFKHQVDLWKI